MLTKLFLIAAISLGACLLALSCGNKASDFQLTDQYQIAQLLNNDPAGRTAFPGVLIDTVNRSSLYKGYRPAGTTGKAFVPQDYWVEIVRHTRVINGICWGVADSLNNYDICGETPLSDGRRVKVRLERIVDSLECRYHIVSAIDSTIAVKTVHFYGDTLNPIYALMAKFNSDNVIYKGWSLYAVGRQREGFAYEVLSRVDSIVLVNSADESFATYPSRGNIFITTHDLPVFSHGEGIGVDVYVHENSGIIKITDVWVHYNVGGVMKHESMGESNGDVYTTSLAESSGYPAGAFGQIVIEMFGEDALQNDSPAFFNNLIWAVTYRVGN